MNRRSKQRIYWRERGGERRAYGDFRDYRDVGGGREALTQPGTTGATTDPAVAQVLHDRRLEELKRLRRQRAILGEGRQRVELAAFADEHLVLKKRSDRFTKRWIRQQQQYLERACAHFGASRNLMAISVEDVLHWVEHLRGTVEGFGERPSGGTLRHHLNALSNLYARANSLNLLTGSYNPVASIMRGEKPRGGEEEARWLEVHDAALLLEAARTVRSRRPDLACPYLTELLATFLLTGGRKAEVCGLEASDISFERKIITFRPNEWRRLKTRKSARTVPLWPQLAEVLEPYLVPPDRTPRAGLLFPTEDRHGRVTMLGDFRKVLDAVAVAAGWSARAITPKMFRHTYCAARLQTLDGGEAVSLYTVSRELGHGSPAMVERIYSHLGQVRHRSEAVEYRVEQHRSILGRRLEALEGATRASS